MNLRHGIALALLGWYLVYMPTPGDTSSSMLMVSAFDTAKECEAAVQKEQKIAFRYFNQHHEYDHIPLHDLSGDAKFQALRWGATCVATDDPRLKGN